MYTSIIRKLKNLELRNILPESRNGVTMEYSGILGIQEYFFEHWKCGVGLLPVDSVICMCVYWASCLATVNTCIASSRVGTNTATRVTASCLGLYSSRSKIGSINATVLPKMKKYIYITKERVIP